MNPYTEKQLELAKQLLETALVENPAEAYDLLPTVAELIPSPLLRMRLEQRMVTLGYYEVKTRHLDWKFEMLEEDPDCIHEEELGAFLDEYAAALDHDLQLCRTRELTQAGVVLLALNTWLDDSVSELAEGQAAFVGADIRVTFKQYPEGPQIPLAKKPPPLRKAYSTKVRDTRKKPKKLKTVWAGVKSFAKKADSIYTGHGGFRAGGIPYQEIDQRRCIYVVGACVMAVGNHTALLVEGAVDKPGGVYNAKTGVWVEEPTNLENVYENIFLTERSVVCDTDFCPQTLLDALSMAAVFSEVATLEGSSEGTLVTAEGSQGGMRTALGNGSGVGQYKTCIDAEEAAKAVALMPDWIDAKFYDDGSVRFTSGDVMVLCLPHPNETE